MYGLIVSSQPGEDNEAPLAVVTLSQADDDDEESRSPKRSKYVLGGSDLGIKPLGYRTRMVHQPTSAWRTHLSQPTPTYATPTEFPRSSRQSIAAIIAAASAAAAAAAPAPEPLPVPEVNGAKKKVRPPKKHQSKEEKEANKEKRLLKLVGAVVVKCMSKHRHDMDHDMFKKHAKEVRLSRSLLL